MQVNRTKWIKKTLKLNRRLTKFSNAISTEDKLLTNRFINIIDVFLQELLNWKFGILLESPNITTETSDFVWYYDNGTVTNTKRED